MWNETSGEMKNEWAVIRGMKNFRVVLKEKEASFGSLFQEQVKGYQRRKLESQLCKTSNEETEVKGK